MADTNLLILAREFKKLRTHVQEVLKMPVGPQGLQGEKGEQGVKGDTGAPGKDGKDGKDGVNGLNGQDGRNGVDGNDGKDGLDGVGVQNAYIDFDNSLVIVLTSGQEINAGFLSQETKDAVVATFKQGAQTLNELLPVQTGNANKFLKTDGENVSWDTLDGSDINLASPPAIGTTTPAAATFTTLTATGAVNFNSNSGTNTFLTRLNTSGQTSGYLEYAVTDGSRYSEFGLALTSVNSYADANEAYFRGSGGTTGTTISSASVTTPRIRFITGASGSSAEQARISNTASAVNYVQVTGAATGGVPNISAQGSDGAIGLTLQSKSASILFLTRSGQNRSFNIADTSSPVNYLQVAGSVSGNTLPLSAQGNDTNISMAFQSKGTGAIDLAAGSSGVNISNGGTVTAITRTAVGSGYTTPPTPAISAPTTAGGVQATASCTLQLASISSIASGGTGYTVGNTLTVSGGTSTTAVQLTVTTVSAGVITAVSVANFGNYTAAPTNPASVTGGTGSGATFNLSFGINATFTITNAGSGYVEQPTVTFSGGGGSGAAAYAVVGSGTTIKSLHTDFFIAGPASSTNIFRFGSVGNAVNNLFTYNNTTGASPVLRSIGSDTNVGFDISSQGTGNIRLLTNAVNQEQLRVAHTASAVNYVQVTGAATGSSIGPSFAAAGSDSVVPLTFTTKSTGAHRFVTGAGLAVTFVDSGGTTANFLQIQGRQAGNGPIISAQGADPNIDVVVTPKGTGLVRFGTRTASADAAITGYIEIKDSGGTIRRLAVIG